MSKELLDALNAEAISRMSPYELADRGATLRMAEHNALDIEPVETEDGKVLYTVTSGLVAPDYHMGTGLDAHDGEIVRHQKTNHPFTLFADVVELQPPAGRSKGQARLFRVEEPLDPILASATGPFREVIDNAIIATDSQPHLRGVRFNDGFVYLRRWEDQPDPDETRYGSIRPDYEQKLSATDLTRLITKNVGANKLNGEVGVQISYRGLVRAALSKGFMVRVTDGKILMGPTYDKNVEFKVPAGEKTHSGYSLIPEEAEIVLKDGQAALKGPGENDDNYKYGIKQPSLTTERIVALASDEELGVEDVTTKIIRELAQQLATALPLDAEGAYEQTVAKARDAVETAIQTGLSPVPGGVGCLAVAARMAELPDHPEGYVVDKDYFKYAE